MQSAPDWQAGGAPCTYRVARLQQIGQVIIIPGAGSDPFNTASGKS